jgi:hypothetical protein
LTLKPLLVLLAALAFGISPAFTPSFRGYDPSQFPIPFESPPVLPAGSAITGPVAKECADLWPRIASAANSIV